MLKGKISIAFIFLFISIFVGACQNNNEASENSESHKKTIEQYILDDTTTLDELLAKSEEQSKVPIIYFHAEWCGPCRSFKKALKDDRVIAAFENAILIDVDVDNDPQGLTNFHFVRSIPTFIKMAPDSSVIARITSAKWDADTPENIAPVMNQLINETVFDQEGL